MTNAKTLPLATALAFALALSSGRARGEESPAARAERLFREAEELFDQRSFTEACSKFAGSHDLDPKLGTLLNLAYCHEMEGKTARARGEFDEALMWAVQKGQRDREQFARDHLAALEKRLAYVILEAPDAEVDMLDVRIDGSVVPRNRWGAPMVMDPGLHMLSAAAPLKEAQPILFYVEPGPSTRTLRIPNLLDDPVAAAKLARNAPLPSPLQPPRRVDPGARAKRTGGLVALGAGALALGAAGYLGYRAFHSAADVRAACATAPCHPDAAGIEGEANAFGAAAAVALGVGAVSIGVGTWLVVSSAPDGRGPGIALGGTLPSPL